MLNRLKLAAAAVFMLAALPVMAQSTANNVVPGHLTTTGCPGMISPCFVPAEPRQPLGYQQVSSLSSATKLTVPAGATVAMIRAESASVRYRDDGTSPTASVGQLILTGDAPLVYVGTLSALTFIQAAAGAAIDVLFYR